MQIKKYSWLNENDNVANVEESLKANIAKGQVGGFSVVCDSNLAVVGVVTDSDLRKARVKFGPQYSEQQAKDVMNTEFLYLFDDLDEESQARQFLQAIQTKVITQELAFRHLPVLNRSHELIKILNFTDIQPHIERITTQVIVIGLGFVGITLSMAMVSEGLEIVGADSNLEILTNIKNGKSHVLEPGLEDILKANIGKKFKVMESKFCEYPRNKFLGKRIYVITVGTPVVNQNIDFNQLDMATKEIAEDLEEGDCVIIRSSVPVGTTQKRIVKVIEQKTNLYSGRDFNVIYAPERTVEGNALREIKELPQLLSGATPQCIKRGVEFFSQFVPTIVVLDSIEACEMGKLISNAYRDVTFAFANEIAEIASENAIDVNKMILDVNIGYSRNNIPYPSPGVGGPCLTKDSYLLVPKNSVESPILSARRFNSLVPAKVAAAIKDKVETDYENDSVVVCIGLAFKGDPPTNDLRESPALEIVSQIQKSGFTMVALDCEIEPNQIKALGYESRLKGDEDIKMICVLNNHLKNEQVVREILEGYENIENLTIFDPWHVCRSIYKKKKISCVWDMSFINLLDTTAE